MPSMLRSLVFALLICMTTCVLSQVDSFLLHTSTPAHRSIYQDYEGSPYYFSAWVKGRLLRSDATYIEDVLMNYNGFTHQIEVESGDTRYALDKRWYLRADVYKKDNPQLGDDMPDVVSFQLGIHREFGDHYGAVLYAGEKLMLIRDFNVGKQNREYSEYGINNFLAEFRDQSTLYLRRDNRLIPIRQHKKKIAEAFADQDRVLEFIAQHDLDVKQDKDLVKLVAFADQL